MKKLLMLLVLFLWMAGVASAAPMFQNGDFENASDPTCDFRFTLGRLIDDSETRRSRNATVDDSGLLYKVLYGRYKGTVELDKDNDDYKLLFKLLNEAPETTFARVDNVRTTGESAPVAEPATILLLGVGLVGIASVRKRFK